MLSGGCLGGSTPGGAVTPAASATPRFGAGAASDSGSVTGQTPARTPMRDKLSINPDDDMYVDGDMAPHQQVVA